jgi:HSP20 family molecular chaperone IbpA
VDPDSAKAEYNNGILEVTLTPMEPPIPKKRINID